MRYYLFTVQHNAETDSENRSVPKAFDTRTEAIKEYHSQISKDMGNAKLDWSINMIINSAMGVEMSEKYEAEIAEETTAEESETT